MRIAIVDDLSGERALLREQLARQLARRDAEAELLEFDSGEGDCAWRGVLSGKDKKG